MDEEEKLQLKKEIFDLQKQVHENSKHSGERRTVPIKTDASFTLKDAGIFFSLLIAIVSAWVKLNSDQVETQTRLKAFEEYYNENLINFKASTQKREEELKELIKEQHKNNKELSEQLNSLERTLSLIYRERRKK